MAENFLTYQEVDALSRLTVTASRVTATDMLAGDDGIYLYIDKGAAYFSGNFIQLLTIEHTASDQGGAQLIFWAMTNDLDDFQGLIDGSKSAIVVRAIHAQTPNLTKLHLTELDSGTAYGDGLGGMTMGAGSVYYLKIVRDETVGTYGTIYLYVYSDEARTTLVNTQTFALHTSAKDFRYVMACQSYDSTAGTTKKFTGYTEYLSFEPADNPETSINPVVTIGNMTSIVATTATGNGYLVYAGLSAVTEHGHCWATTVNPTTANSKTTNGAGSVGAFTSAITGLTSGTRYYVRAYATNSYGTAYSTGISFISGDSTSITIKGNLKVVGTNLIYIGSDGKTYTLTGT